MRTKFAASRFFRRALAHLALSLPLLLQAGWVIAADIHQAEVEARVPWAPQPFLGGDGAIHFCYELHITNFYASTGPLRLKRLVVYSGSDETPVVTFTGAQIDALRSQHEPAKDAASGVSIEGGRRTVLFMWITLPKGAPTPLSLRHRLEFDTQDGQTQVADSVLTPVDQASVVVVGPPLRTGRWLAVEGPGNRLSHHWGSLVAIDGQVTIPQRFASDWFGLDAAGRSVHASGGEISKTTDADWVGFGADVLAVGDGVVVDARDGIADGVPLAPQSEPIDLTDRSLYGNFVVLRIGPNLFAHYAHLRNGSLRVAVGEHIRRGAVIGALGQTGSAGAPHLHFQISNAATFEGSEGVPFVFDRYRLFGSAKIEDTFDTSKKLSFATGSSQARRMELPLDGDVVQFPTTVP